METKIIAAVSDNGVIGKNDDIPWYIPDDLKRFKDLTQKHPVLAGRKTYDSIIKRLGRPLPKRLNIVLSRTKQETNHLNVYFATSLNDAIRDLKQEIPFLEGIDYSILYIIGAERYTKQQLVLLIV